MNQKTNPGFEKTSQQEADAEKEIKLGRNTIEGKIFDAILDMAGIDKDGVDKTKLAEASSRAEYIFNLAKETGGLTNDDEKIIREMIKFSEIETRGAYFGDIYIAGRKKNYSYIFKNSKRNLHGLAQFMDSKEIGEFFKRGKNPYETLSDGDLNEIRFKTKKGDEMTDMTSAEVIKKRSDQIKGSAQAIDRLKTQGFVVNSEHGNIIFDTKKPSTSGKRVRNIGLGANAAFGNNFDAYVIWSPEEGYFSIYSKNPLETFVERDGSNAESVTSGRKFIGSTETTSLEEILSKLAGQNFQPKGKLKEYLEGEKKKRDFQEKVYEKFGDKQEEINLEKREEIERLKGEINNINEKVQKSYDTENFEDNYKVIDRRSSRESVSPDYDQKVFEKEERIRELERELKMDEVGESNQKNSDEEVEIERLKREINELNEREQKPYDRKKLELGKVGDESVEAYKVVDRRKGEEIITPDVEKMVAEREQRIRGLEGIIAERNKNDDRKEEQLENKPEIDSEKLEETLRKKSIENQEKINAFGVSNSESFEDLYSELEKIGEIQGSSQKFSATEIIKSIKLARNAYRDNLSQLEIEKISNGMLIVALTRTYGIRDKVIELIIKEREAILEKLNKGDVEKEFPVSKKSINEEKEEEVDKDDLPPGVVDVEFYDNPDLKLSNNNYREKKETIEMREAAPGKFEPENMDQKIERLKEDLARERREYLQIDYKKNTAFQRVYKFLGTKFSGNQNSRRENDPDIAYYRAHYDNKLFEYKNALLEKAKAEGADGKKLAEILKIFELESGLEMANAHTEIKTENQDGKISRKIKEGLIKLTEKYQQLPLKKKLAIGAAFGLAGVGAGVVGSSALISAVAMTSAGRRFAMGSITGTGLTMGLEKRTKGKMEGQAEKEALMVGEEVGIYSETRRLEEINKLIDAKILDENNRIDKIKNKNLRILFYGTIAGSLISTGLGMEMAKYLGGKAVMMDEKLGVGIGKNLSAFKKFIGEKAADYLDKSTKGLVKKPIPVGSLSQAPEHIGPAKPGVSGETVAKKVEIVSEVKQGTGISEPGGKSTMPIGSDVSNDRIHGWKTGGEPVSNTGMPQKGFAPTGHETPVKAKIVDIETVRKGGNVWKLAEKQLEERYGQRFSQLNPAQKTYLIDSIKDQMAKKSGGGINVDQIRPGQKIDFSKVFSHQERIERAFEKAQKLSPRQMENILKNNKNIADWLEKHPGKPLNSQRVAEILENKKGSVPRPVVDHDIHAKASGARVETFVKSGVVEPKTSMIEGIADKKLHSLESRLQFSPADSADNRMIKSMVMVSSGDKNAWVNIKDIKFSQFDWRKDHAPSSKAIRRLVSIYGEKLGLDHAEPKKSETVGLWLVRIAKASSVKKMAA